MSSFTNALVTKPVGLYSASGKQMLLVGATFVWERGHLGSGDKVVIPKGFLTDGVSAPWYAEWALPVDHMLPAAVLHDWLLTQLEWEKKRVDLEFRIAMKACGVRQPYRELAYIAVSLNKSKRGGPLILYDS